jgi:hypothetical protein
MAAFATILGLIMQYGPGVVAALGSILAYLKAAQAHTVATENATSLQSLHAKVSSLMGARSVPTPLPPPRSGPIPLRAHELDIND